MVRRYRGASLLTNAALTQHNNFNAMRRALRTERVRLAALFPIAMIAVVSVWPRTASASSGKPDGQACLTNQSCSSGVCVNSGPPGSHTFGVCCTPTTCAATGANCGTIPNGTCPNALDCGICTSPNTCGGGGTANVCGCTPSTTCPAGDNCGSVPNGCGGTVNCGSCTSPNTCGGGGTPNVCGCTPRTCAEVGASGGTISDGCGQTLDCTALCNSDADCSSTQFCLQGRCSSKSAPFRPCYLADECVSGCCCGLAVVPLSCVVEPPSAIDPALGVPLPGQCIDLATCVLFQQVDAPGQLLPAVNCPGFPCGQDSDCPQNQFCTGGACVPKEAIGAQCEFSSACADSAACCCTLPGASNGVCSLDATCAGAGGTCECSAGDVGVFGGVCPGTPCGEDSECSSLEFCTGGACTLKRPSGSACAFTSACVDGCCCGTGSTGLCSTAPSCTSTCLP